MKIMQKNQKTMLQVLIIAVIAIAAWHFASNAGTYGPWVVRPAMVILGITLFASEALVEKYL